MTDLFHKNVTALFNKDRILAGEIDKISESGKYRIIEGKSGFKCIEYTYNGKAVLLNSYYDPVREGKRWAENLQYKGEDILIVFGFGAGYHLANANGILDRYSKVLIIDPSIECFKYALYMNDFTDLFKADNVFFYIQSDISKLRNVLLKLIDTTIYQKFKIVDFVPVERNYREYFNSVRKEVLKLLNDNFLTLNTKLVFSKKWTKNLMENLPYILESAGVSKLFLKFQGVPLFLISAGPSLDKNVHLLKYAKGKSVLLSVGTALKALLKNGIEPDLVIAIDPSDKAYEQFRGIDNFKAPLVFDPLVNANIPRNYKGKKFVCESLPFFTSLLRENIGKNIGNLKKGGSVANVAFDLAVKMGCNPIVFVGQDLAFTEGKSHASGTMYDGEKVKNTENTIVVKDIYGNDIQTTRQLFSFLTWFENEIKLYNGKIEFIDATEGGAKIEGTQVMALSEAIKKYCYKEIDIDAVINAAVKDNHLSGEGIKKLVTALHNIKLDLAFLEDKLKKGIEYTKKLKELLDSKTPEQRRINKLLKKLNKIDRIVKRNQGKNFIDLVLQPVIVSILQNRRAENEVEDAAEASVEKTALLYDNIRIECNTVINLIEKAVIDIKERFDVNLDNFKTEGGFFK
ncbi:MAG: hypothetical protein PWR14_814 [Thermosediminibacterales bacterium]|jgi:hypothetical protein|nr:hypothetical protein [Thermosediminibacterales bacterium]